VALEALDVRSRRLLLLAHTSLQRLGVDDPSTPRLKGIYRHAWARHQLLGEGELLVPAARASTAVDVLCAVGWTTRAARSGPPRRGLLDGQASEVHAEGASETPA
jgi:hypothetical protein